MNRKNVNLIGAIVALLIVGGVAGYFIMRAADDEPATKTTSQEEISNTAEENSAALALDKTRYPTDKPASLWVIINKQHSLPADFVPPLASVREISLQPEAGEALEQLIKAAAGAQVPLKTISGYRSYETQKNLYDTYVQKDGQAAADTYSARPGHSEHQTGLAADLGNSNGQCDLEECFASTPGGTWLAANAHAYGFTIRYTEDKTNITGYQYEPWHLRYVGVDLASELHTKAQTMEEFFDLPPAPGY